MASSMSRWSRASGDGVGYRFSDGSRPAVEFACGSNEKASALEGFQVVDPQRHQRPQSREPGGLPLGGQRNVALEDL
jgi:hypothetical protein